MLYQLPGLFIVMIPGLKPLFHTRALDLFPGKPTNWDVIYMHWNLGSRTHLLMNNSVHEQIFRARDVSDDERCLGLRTRKLATAVGDKLRVSARECQLLVNFGSVHIPA
jgi:hypothetical protein